MSARRIVRLLDPKAEPTPRQLAQRKYRASAKGRAAAARSLAVKRARPDHGRKEYARVKRWRHANRMHYRVYNRVARARRRALQRAA